MKDVVKSSIKVAKWVKNGYLERDYSYLEKMNFIKSDEKKIRLNLVISSVDKNKMYGGLTTAVNIYQYLCKELAADMRMIVTSEDVNEEILKQYPDYKIQKSEVDSSDPKVISTMNVINNKRGTISVRCQDYFLATYWSTFYIISDVIKFQKESFDVNNKLLYLIQDFEPGFYQWSTEYFLSDSTYRSGNTIAIFNSYNLMNYFKKLDYKFDAMVAFEPKLNATLLSHLDLTDGTKRKKRVIIYGRPNVARNAFSIIVGALNKMIEKNHPSSEWEYLSIGGKHKDIKLSENNILKAGGKLTLEEYAHVLAESSVGVSLMCSPHPSYPPLEMSAFGVNTVTNSFLCKKLSGFSDNIISLDIVNFDTVADAIHQAMDRYQERKEVNKAAGYLNLEDQFEEVGEAIKGVLLNER